MSQAERFADDALARHGCFTDAPEPEVSAAVACADAVAQACKEVAYVADFLRDVTEADDLVGLLRDLTALRKTVVTLHADVMVALTEQIELAAAFVNVREILDDLLDATAYEAGAKARIDRLRRLLYQVAVERYEEEEAAPSWKTPGYGRVRLDVPEEKPTVVDDDAWLAHVKQVSPDDVVISERVRENVLPAIAGRCERVGDSLVDPETGEVVPGVEFRKGVPRLVVNLDPSRKKAAIDEALEELADEGVA